MTSVSDMENQSKKSVLFVCLGNTCRSTMSEGIFQHLIKQKGIQEQWEIDSAAIADWQVGNPADQKTMNILWENNITDYHHIARQITAGDFFKFQYILGMDRWNYKHLKEMAPDGSPAQIGLLGQYDDEGEQTEIHDPYMAPQKEFAKIYKKCYRCCSNFLAANSSDDSDVK